MHELGLLDEFLKRPHQKQVSRVRARIGRDEILLGDLSLLSTHCRFMVMMPQWEFLDFLAEQARRYPTFHLRMETEVTGLIEENGRIVGVRGNSPAGPLEVRATLVVGADGSNPLSGTTPACRLRTWALLQMCSGCGCPGTRTARRFSSTPIAAELCS
jgi:2-polyprenyl-6-methoxyphenol hydroxylase-like FAD-dependent oxidoreductase